MKNLGTIKKLIGESVTNESLKYVDCYVQEHVGLFIPTIGQGEYAIMPQQVHPAYRFVICFEQSDALFEPTIPLKENHYLCVATSPGVEHEENTLGFLHYYCILIEKEYFESQYHLYRKGHPFFKREQFLVCHDILKMLNGFAFEYSKEMPNAEITLNAQATIITHWLIRSILGENYDMRAISSNYSIARAEHYIEQHFAESVTVTKLAELGNMSVSNFIRTFKKEMHLTPKEYLINVRIEKAKKLLRRNELTITEVSMRCGFSSSAHFTNSFTHLMGMTPTEYRNRYKDQ